MTATGSVSPISLNQLPKPYDISVAVQQAFKLNSPSDVETCRPAMEISLIEDNDIYRGILTYRSSCDSLEKEIEGLLPDIISEDLLDDMWNNVTLPDLDVEGENAANMEELEQFVKYIDGEDESNEKNKTQQSQKPQYARKLLTPTPSSLTYKVELVNSEIWQRFSSVGTEMVITKNGRRMFPAIIISVDGLSPDSLYSIYLEILPADDRRYKYMQTDWLPVGKVDKKFTYRSYIHPESPNTGVYWMEKPISFKFAKLTNNKSTEFDDQIILNSMQKYIPSIRITCESKKDKPVTQSFQFPDTTFIAVTAYQNSKMTQLKIENNPYARAFRDSIPSETTSEAMKKDHFSSPTKTVSLPQHQTLPSPNIQINKEGDASVDSGFDNSNSCSEMLFQNNCAPTIPSNPLPLESPYGCPLNFWADEYSLYNNGLIYPAPLLDHTVSFSEPYLRQTSQMHLEAQEVIISPIKIPECSIKIPECPQFCDPPTIIDVGYDDDVFM